MSSICPLDTNHGCCACRYYPSTISPTIKATTPLKSIFLGRCCLESNSKNLPCSSHRTDDGTRYRHTRGRFYLARFDAFGFTTLRGGRHVWSLAFSLPPGESENPFHVFRTEASCDSDIGPILVGFSHHRGDTTYRMYPFAFSHVILVFTTLRQVFVMLDLNGGLLPFCALGRSSLICYVPTRTEYTNLVCFTLYSYDLLLFTLFACLDVPSTRT